MESRSKGCLSQPLHGISSPEPYSRSKMLTVDSSVWVSALSGLLGTGVGGGLSIWATNVAQRQSAKNARQLVVAQQVDAAVDIVIKEMYMLKEHTQGEPRERSRWPVWENSLRKRTSKLKTVLIRLRDQELRERLLKTMSFLDSDAPLTDRAWQGSDDIRVRLCNEALECLGSFVRDEEIPPPGVAFETATRIEREWFDQMTEEAEELGLMRRRELNR